MSGTSFSLRNLFTSLNPYKGADGIQAFVDDVRKEGIIKPVFYGLAVGAGVFDATSKIGKHVVRKPMENYVITPLKFIMGLEKSQKQPFKEKILDILQQPEITFGLSAGAGAALGITGLYGVHHLLKNVILKSPATKDNDHPKI